jgi:hypothetical protein
MSEDFPAFAPSEEHQALRESVRALAAEKIAPRAPVIDRTGEFPWDVYELLVRADLHAVHIPEAYGGAGADAIATAIVIEEVARACASSSLIPAVNKLGTVPLLLGASEEVKARYLAPRHPGSPPLIALKGARDLLPERLHPAAKHRAPKPAQPGGHHHPPGVDRHVRRRPLVIPVHAPGPGPAAGAWHLPARARRPDPDHLARVLDILDDQRRQSREHSPHKLHRINHD